MGRGRRPVAVELRDEDRATLEGWSRRPKTSQALAVRARIVLRAADGLNSTAIAEELQVHLADGPQVAGAVCRAGRGWIAR